MERIIAGIVADAQTFASESKGLAADAKTVISGGQRELSAFAAREGQAVDQARSEIIAAIPK